MGEILAHASPSRKRLRRRNLGTERAGDQAQLMLQPIKHDVEETEHIAAGIGTARSGKGRDILIGAGESGLAHIEAWRELLDRPAHDPLGIAGLDLAFDQDAELAEGAVGGEGVGNVAERILVLIEPAIRRNIDPPARDILAVVIARGQPQHLDHTGRRTAVTVADLVCDAKAHGGLYIRYCSVMAAPRRLLSSMKSLMNSCTPV